MPETNFERIFNFCNLTNFFPLINDGNRVFWESIETLWTQGPTTLDFTLMNHYSDCETQKSYSSKKKYTVTMLKILRFGRNKLNGIEISTIFVEWLTEVMNSLYNKKMKENNIKTKIYWLRKSILKCRFSIPIVKVIFQLRKVPLEYPSSYSSLNMKIHRCLWSYVNATYQIIPRNLSNSFVMIMTSRFCK